MGRKKHSRKLKRIEKLKHLTGNSCPANEEEPGNLEMGQISSSSSEVNSEPFSDNKAEKSVDPVFYGIFIPFESDHSKVTDTPVFTDKGEALRVLKQNKRARLKVFSCKEEAIKFSRCGEIGKTASEGSCNYEKIYYRGPKSQDLVKFRKAIESGDVHLVRKMIEENPRYLVGSGDTPAILQEGSRYNALHVAAKTHSASMCSYILSVISNIEFSQRLYGIHNGNHLERVNILLDLYLNMPDKGCNETPLHFASKLGALDVVKVLVSYQQCDKSRLNKEGCTPMEIACSRAPEHLLHNKSEIIRALGTLYYVPILRSEDNALQPSVGEPFTPLNPPELLSPTKADPFLEVRALAGPMTEDEARSFRKMWKTPPRTPKDALKYRPELCDPEKGLEKVGRRLAHEYHVEWKEYWNFLDSFVDLSSPEGLSALDNYIKKEFKKNYDIRSNISVTPFSKLESYDTMEETSYLSIENSGKSRFPKTPVSKPEDDYRNHGVANGSHSLFDIKDCEFDPLELTLRNESPMFFEGYNHVIQRKKKPTRPIINSMEQSCKVFAHRIASALTQRQKLYAILSISSFQVFLAGCSADLRFVDVDLSKSHYRLSALLKDNILIAEEDRGPAIELLCDIMSENLKEHVDNEKISYENLKEAIVCIGRFTIALLSYRSVDMISSGADSDVLWTAAEACSCSIPSLRTSKRFLLSPKVLFPADDNVLNQEVANYRRLSSRSNSSSGSSDLEDYYTAPSSPVQDDAFGDESMFMSETGPDVFLNGDKPTKLDKAVLEAIENVEICPYKYPYITLWKLSCTQRSKSEPIERWPTPKSVQRSILYNK